MIKLAWLDPDDPDWFPPVEAAIREPDGLLAAGGDLSPQRLLAAYRRGIFPWFSPGQPILWWSPSERAVFDTHAMHVPRRLRRWLRRCDWELRIDTAFDRVIDACASTGSRADGTWITPEMLDAYRSLHRLGHAHSFEAWDGDELAGGMYGVAVGRLFCGESMYSARDNGSKVALLSAARWLSGHGFPLLDAQIVSPHLATLGMRVLPRADYTGEAARLARQRGIEERWTHGPAPLRAHELGPPARP